MFFCCPRRGRYVTTPVKLNHIEKPPTTIPKPPIIPEVPVSNQNNNQQNHHPDSLQFQTANQVSLSNSTLESSSQAEVIERKSTDQLNTTNTLQTKLPEQILETDTTVTPITIDEPKIIGEISVPDQNNSQQNHHPDSLQSQTHNQVSLSDSSQVEYGTTNQLSTANTLQTKSPEQILETNTSVTPVLPTNNENIESEELHNDHNIIEDTDDMSNRRTRITADVDNSDIQGPVPLITRRSLVYSVSREEPIQEEDVQRKSSSSIKSKDKEVTSEVVHLPTVNFVDTIEYFGHEDDEKTDINLKERRGGIIEAINVDSTTEIPKFPKSPEDILHLKNAFAANDFLANVLKGEALDKVISAMHERRASGGEVIIQEGDPGNSMYVSSRGTYEIYVRKKLFATFSDKRVFGELAILYNSKRMATIKAITDGKYWVLQRDIYQQIVVRSVIKDSEETLSFLRNVPLVNELDEKSLSKIVNLLQKEFFKTDSVIVREGEPGDKFYIIRAGCVTITKEIEGKVSELGKGAFFGERALLNDDRRQATVTADAPGVECLTLTREEFKKHFHDLSLSPEKNGKATVENLIGLKPSTKLPPVNEYSDIPLGDLKRIATLGVGGFGRVELVQHKKDPQLIFALKYLKKIDMLQQEQVEHVFNERDIQINCNSIFIARLYKTFQDSKYLYFLMEACLGGDLWTFLQKRKGRRVPETDARFYAGCVLEAFSYLHERNYIYRDLKPENLLIDNKGYIKLTDFGFAKNLNTANKTYTFAGTPEYVAPEIIYNRGHDKSVDYWAFGILIYELLVGKTPFKTDDRTNMMTYNRILRGINSVTFPHQVNKTATQLIQKLCRPIATDRLGNQKNGIEDIRNHKWFLGFDWEKLRNQKMKAPFVPKLNSNTDTSYFEKFNDDDDIPPDELNSFQSF